ncbi:hypothetical protein [Aestuariicoccus sp. MJ-SS9]|uniref:hypothetical protein n=1 Tax=Aestuariicoccus sp. MJ-SS9 TaxID=3079855 RepID=UPI0029115406|nr:hypothetical protein [Aestuariicoccus sp. MJ-SS9]MDU8914224.1 hypothetical protein [Aestuariicoccus sp. MJ-SS9]
MTGEQERHEDHPMADEQERLSQKLDAVGWALFLIWVGFAFLFDFGWAWGPIGIAAIIFGEAVVRLRLNLKIEGFWIVVGLMFLVGGLWELFKIPWPLAPFLMIGCGLAVLWGVFGGKYLMKK